MESKRIGIVGLGLIGGSFAEAGAAADCAVTARTQTPPSFSAAVASGAVDGPLDGAALASVDLARAGALPARVRAEWLRACRGSCRAPAVVMDCGGVKAPCALRARRSRRNTDSRLSARIPWRGTERLDLLRVPRRPVPRRVHPACAGRGRGGAGAGVVGFPLQARLRPGHMHGCRNARRRDRLTPPSSPTSCPAPISRARRRIWRRALPAAVFRI